MATTNAAHRQPNAPPLTPQEPPPTPLLGPSPHGLEQPPAQTPARLRQSRQRPPKTAQSTRADPILWATPRLMPELLLAPPSGSSSSTLHQRLPKHQHWTSLTCVHIHPSLSEACEVGFATKKFLARIPKGHLRFVSPLIHSQVHATLTPAHPCAAAGNHNHHHHVKRSTLAHTLHTLHHPGVR